MKTKIFILLICNLLICNLSVAQNITTTLGTGGLFSIKDTSATFLSLSQSTGYLSLNRSLVLPGTTSSTLGIIFKGANRFLHNYQAPGTMGNNTFLGINAGNFTMSFVFDPYDCSSNTGIGYFSLYSLTTGYNNTALGYRSLNFNTAGAENTAVGGGSLYSNTTGGYNTAVGNSSLYFNTTGLGNIALGGSSLYSNTTGNWNTALGYNSLY